MPTVVIFFREGKSVDQKRALAKNVTKGVVDAFGVDAGQVSIQLIEQKAEHVATGGVLKADQL